MFPFRSRRPFSRSLFPLPLTNKTYYFARIFTMRSFLRADGNGAHRQDVGLPELRRRARRHHERQGEPCHAMLLFLFPLFEEARSRFL